MRAMQWALATCGKLFIALCIGTAAATSAAAQSAIIGPHTPPHDERLMRLSAILGAIAYLLRLRGANDGQGRGDRMKELMDAEGPTALRRAKLTRSFNNGYRSYSRTYNNCTPSAQTAITRFLAEGAELAEALIKSVP